MIETQLGKEEICQNYNPEVRACSEGLRFKRRGMTD